MRIWIKNSILCVVFMVRVFMDAQNHPLDIVNASDGDAYNKVWQKATLIDVQEWLKTKPDLNVYDDWGGYTILIGLLLITQALR